MVLPALGLLEVILLGAVLALTDAALGQAVVNNVLVPVGVRQGLNVKAASTTGSLLVAIAFAGATGESGALGHWLFFALLQNLSEGRLSRSSSTGTR